jgi:hypothetical protein
MDMFSNHPLYRKHNIDTAMSSIWEFYKSKFLSLFIISAAMSLIIQYASTLADFRELQSITDPVQFLEKIKSFLVPILIISLVNLLFTTILQYYIIYNPLDSQNNFFTCLLKSMKYFVPYLILMILLAFFGTIAIVLGVFALIIGAFFAVLYIMALYLFVLPVLMIEGPNIGSAINRSFRLLHKNFWTNIGWVAVFLIVLIVISVIFSAIILIPFTGGFLKAIFNPGSGSGLVEMTTRPLFIILSALVSALTLPLMPIFACVLYFNARASEEDDKLIVPGDPVNDKVRVEDLYAKPYSDDHPDNPDKKV